MLGGLGSSELLIISVIILVFFGSKKLNELARGLGESTKEVKKVKREYDKAVSGNFDTDDEPKKKKSTDKEVKES